MNLDTDLARENMIRQQVRGWNVTDPRVLHALEVVPRDHFVTDRYATLAYADTALPLADRPDEVMLTPQVNGRILQALQVAPTDRILEIGTGSGYLAACLAVLGQHVTSIDSSAERVERARERIADLGFENVECIVQDVYQRRERTTFDAIAVTGSIRQYDPRFEQWLNPGGRAFVVIGTAPAMEACLITRNPHGPATVESLFETVIDPLETPGLHAPNRFRF